MGKAAEALGASSALSPRVLCPRACLLPLPAAPVTPPAPSLCQSHTAAHGHWCMCVCVGSVMLSGVVSGRDTVASYQPLVGGKNKKKSYFPEGCYSEQSTLPLGKDLSPPRRAWHRPLQGFQPLCPLLRDGVRQKVVGIDPSSDSSRNTG